MPNLLSDGQTIYAKNKRVKRDSSTSREDPYGSGEGVEKNETKKRRKKEDAASGWRRAQDIHKFLK
jgi:hypothetical protein